MMAVVIDFLLFVCGREEMNLCMNHCSFVLFNIVIFLSV
jgi:hypothetical protein